MIEHRQFSKRLSLHGGWGTSKICVNVFAFDLSSGQPHPPTVHDCHNPALQVLFSNILASLQKCGCNFHSIKLIADAFHDSVCVHEKARHMLTSFK